MAVACGGQHTVMVTEWGCDVFVCGRGNSGQLGCGTQANSKLPAPVPELDRVLRNASRITMVAAGRRHSAAITSQGELLVWGSGAYGQLGNGDREDRHSPSKLHRALLPRSARVVMVSCGNDHTLAVTDLGSLFSFGAGGDGRLGLGDTTDRLSPCEVKRFHGAKIVYAAAGAAHSGAVTSEGCVFTWGTGYSGRLGHGDDQGQLVPKELAWLFGSCRAVLLSAGGAHTMILMDDGGLWGCGDGGHGKLGLGSVANELVPARVGAREAFGRCKVLTVACGDAHTLACTDDGGLWSWGSGYGGKLGHADELDRLSPERVAAGCLNGVKVVAVACANVHSAAVTEDGHVLTWGVGEIFFPGSQELAGLGHEDLERRLVPSVVDSLLEQGTRVGRFLPLSRDHSMAVAMGTHARLGTGHSMASEQCKYLQMPAELVQMVVEACRVWPEGVPVEADGLARLMGGGRMRGKGDEGRQHDAIV